MKINPYRTILLWGAWATMSIIVYLTLYIDAKIWTFMENDPSRVTWIIMALFGFGVLSSAFITVIITKEGLGIQRILKAAQEKGLRGISDLSGNSVSKRFFRALQDTLNADGQPDADVLANIELASFQRHSHSIEVVGNLLITLGLIGTVMGLTLTLTGLTNSLEALGHDQQLLLAGLQKAMAGMGTAFYTTLLGAVLGGVLLRIFAQITEDGVGRLYDQLMRICLVYCSADYKPSLGREMRHLNSEMERLEHNVRLIKSSFSLSRDSMQDFNKDLRMFVRGDKEHDQESIDTVIKRHQEYCQLLREELHLINAVNKSWWARLKMLMGFK